MKTNYAKKPDSAPAKAAGSFCACKFAFASMHSAESRSAEKFSSQINSKKGTSLPVPFSLFLISVLMLGSSFLISGSVPVFQFVLAGAPIVSVRMIRNIILKYPKALPHSIFPVRFQKVS